ncbi:Protease Do, partial [Moritella viscosa]
MNVKFFASLLIIFCSLFTQATVAALPNVDANGSALPSLAPMLKKINPAVVNI